MIFNGGSGVEEDNVEICYSFEDSIHIHDVRRKMLDVRRLAWALLPPVRQGLLRIEVYRGDLETFQRCGDSEVATSAGLSRAPFWTGQHDSERPLRCPLYFVSGRRSHGRRTGRVREFPALRFPQAILHVRVGHDINPDYA